MRLEFRYCPTRIRDDGADVFRPRAARKLSRDRGLAFSFVFRNGFADDLVLALAIHVFRLADRVQVLDKRAELLQAIACGARGSPADRQYERVAAYVRQLPVFLFQLREQGASIFQGNVVLKIRLATGVSGLRCTGGRGSP